MEVPFWRHGLGDEERDAFAEASRDLHLTTGSRAGALEERIAEISGVEHALATTSATTALHLLLLAHGVGPGDEVVVPSTSFVSTANVALYVGAKPVFCDVDPETGNMDPAAAAAAIGPGTAALLPVHLYGRMAEMGALGALARDRGLLVVEDAAHALEATSPEGPPGAVSNGAAYSFYATKSATVGEGGALALADGDVAAAARRLRLHGLDSSPAHRGEGLYRHYDMVELGLKCNMDDLKAAVLIPQLEADRMAARVKARERVHALYREALAGVPGVKLPPAQPEGGANYLFTVRVAADLRDEFMAGLERRGIGIAVNFRPIHLMSYYRERYGHREGEFPAAEALGAETITLPSHGRLTEAEIDAVAAAVRAVATELA